jgi:3-dehydroquinate dehydratase/shikimate dehydrogenase
MIVLVIAEHQYSNISQKIQSVIKDIDVIELRLDYLDYFDLTEIKRIKLNFDIPIIFTLRKKSQGGLFLLSENIRLNLLTQLAGLEPDYIDLEYDVPIEFVRILKKQHPKIKLIRSYHDFVKTPQNLMEIFTGLNHDLFTCFKIVTFAQSSLDCLRVLAFVNSIDNNVKITSFCMGGLGIVSRILGPIVANYFHYTCVDDLDDIQLATGQLKLSTLLDTYRLRTLNPNTSIYALIGDPVENSIGDIFHNKVFNRLEYNSVYVKIKLQETELQEFFQLMKLLPFKGLSVTMPLKQAVIPFLNQISDIANKISSVNTIIISQGKLIGDNTDACGALDALEETILVANKTIIIIGAGGAARAIGYEAIKRQAKVIFVNRTAAKAYDLGQHMNSLGYGFDEVKNIQCRYDIIINTTSVGMNSNDNTFIVLDELLKPNLVIMDIVYNPINTKLLQKAQLFNCNVVYGYMMFFKQAILQLRLWN